MVGVRVWVSRGKGDSEGDGEGADHGGGADHGEGEGNGKRDENLLSVGQRRRREDPRHFSARTSKTFGGWRSGDL